MHSTFDSCLVRIYLNQFFKILTNKKNLKNHFPLDLTIQFPISTSNVLLIKPASHADINNNSLET